MRRNASLVGCDEVFGGYAMLNFAIFFFQAPHGGSGANPPAVVWRGFSGHWMLFYSAALATYMRLPLAPRTDPEPLPARAQQRCR